jgi:hypothetical protein
MVTILLSFNIFYVDKVVNEEFICEYFTSNFLNGHNVQVGSGSGRVRVCNLPPGSLIQTSADWNQIIRNIVDPDTNCDEPRRQNFYFLIFYRLISSCFFSLFQASTPRRPRPLPWRQHNQRRKEPWTRLLAQSAVHAYSEQLCVHDSSPHFPPASCLPAVSFRRQNGSSAREMLSLLQEQALPQVEVQQV